MNVVELAHGAVPQVMWFRIYRILVAGSGHRVQRSTLMISGVCGLSMAETQVHAECFGVGVRSLQFCFTQPHGNATDGSWSDFVLLIADIEVDEGERMSSRLRSASMR